MIARLLGCALFVGCGGDLLCGEYTTEVDGTCVGQAPIEAEEPEPPRFEDLVLAMDKCTSTSGDGDLDLDAGCVGDGCIGDTYGELNTAFGAVGQCDSVIETLPEWLRCSWPNGVSAVADDYDLDGEPDQPIDNMSVVEPYLGLTDDGLGIGVEMGCFIAAYGAPADFEAKKVGTNWYITRSAWPESNISVRDNAFAADGYVDAISW